MNHHSTFSPPLHTSTVVVSPVPPGAAGLRASEIMAARTLSRLRRLLERSFGERKARSILVESVQQRLRTGKDIRDIVVSRAASAAH